MLLKFVFALLFVLVKDVQPAAIGNEEKAFVVGLFEEPYYDEVTLFAIKRLV